MNKSALMLLISLSLLTNLAWASEYAECKSSPTRDVSTYKVTLRSSQFSNGDLSSAAHDVENNFGVCAGYSVSAKGDLFTLCHFIYEPMWYFFFNIRAEIDAKIKGLKVKYANSISFECQKDQN